MFHHVAVEPMCNLQKRLKYIRQQLAFYALDMASSNPATELENVVFFWHLCLSALSGHHCPRLTLP